MDLDVEEIKLLLLNLIKKKDTVTDEHDLLKIDNRIKELSDNLKHKNQTGINQTFLSIFIDVDSLMDKLNEQMDKSIDQLSENYVTINSLTHLTTTIKDKLNAITSYQQELQNVDTPINFYFDFLVIPINRNVNDFIPQVTNSFINQNPVIVSSPIVQQLSAIQNINNIPPQQLINSNPLRDVNSHIFKNMRAKAQYFIQQENYEKVYEILRGDRLTIDTFGMEDLLQKPSVLGGTVGEQVKIFEPVTDDYKLLENDEGEMLANSQSEVHYSAKAQEVLSIDSNNDFNHGNMNNIDDDDNMMMPKATSVISKLKNFF